MVMVLIIMERLLIWINSELNKVCVLVYFDLFYWVDIYIFLNNLFMVVL